jgi:Mce-associated membrane protein
VRSSKPEPADAAEAPVPWRSPESAGAPAETAAPGSAAPGTAAPGTAAPGTAAPEVAVPAVAGNAAADGCTATGEHTVSGDLEASDEPDVSRKPGKADGWRRLRLPRHELLVPVFVAVVLIAAGAVLLAATSGLRGGPATANHALTDAGQTQAVAAAVSTDVTEIYSYSYTDIPATVDAARRVLTGQAATQYSELAPLLSNAVAEKLTVRTSVVRAGVSWLSGGTAQLLVFMNQTASRGGGKPTTVAAQLAITAQFSGRVWRITNIEAR